MLAFCFCLGGLSLLSILICQEFSFPLDKLVDSITHEYFGGRSITEQRFGTHPALQLRLDDQSCLCGVWCLLSVSGKTRHSKIRRIRNEKDIMLLADCQVRNLLWACKSSKDELPFLKSATSRSELATGSTGSGCSCHWSFYLPEELLPIMNVSSSFSRDWWGALRI